MGVTRNMLNWYARMAPRRGRTTPPYEHIVQIGDPTLRKVSDPVPVDKIKTEQIQTVLKKLQAVIYKYGSVGMSAPQIGVNLRIFVMMITPKQIDSIPKDIAARRGMTVVPYTVLINPKMKVIDYQKIIHSEGCESVRGFSADVARYKEIQVSGFNPNGEEISQVFKDWPARIAQHELEHLDGKIYTDVMDRKSLTCTCWEEVNLSQGKVVIPFMPE